MHDKRGFNPQTRHTYFLEFPTPIARRAQLSSRTGGAERDHPDQRRWCPVKKPIPPVGPRTARFTFFWGLNRIPAPETNHARQMNRDLVYWSRPLGNQGTPLVQFAERGTFSPLQNCAKNRKFCEKSRRNAGAAGALTPAHSRTFLHAHPHSVSGRKWSLPLETHQSWE